MSDTELEALVAGLTGRMAMLETLNANLLARLVAQFDNPIPLAASIMDATITQLSRHRPDQTEVEQRIQRAAIQSFEGLSTAMLAMINRIAEPQGRA